VIDAKRSPSEPISIKVELFGSARLLCGSRVIDVETPQLTNTQELTTTLATNHPELVGKVIRADRRGLLENYTFNLNGVSFIDNGVLRLHSGDSILLFSSQAGG
jgi:molybdopterin converting factor small subunit